DLHGQETPRRCERLPRHRDGATPTAASATVGAGDDLEEVAVVAEEVDAAAAVVAVDLAGTALAGVGPVLHLALDDAAVDRVELVLGDEERVVDAGDLAAGRGEGAEPTSE